MAPTLFASSLSGSLTLGSTNNVDLSAANITDWAVWGIDANTSLAPNDRMSGGSAISDLTNIDPNDIPLRALGQFGNYGQTTFQWTNGTSTPIATDVNTGLQHDGEESIGSAASEGFSFTISGLALQGEVNLWLGVHRGLATITVSLNGTEDQVFTLEGLEAGYSSVNQPGLLTFDYNKDNTSDSITVSVVLTENYSTINSGNVFINGVDVIENLESIPEPSSFALFGLGALGLAVYRRKRTA